MSRTTEPATLEHANITVRDARATAGWMRDVFGWRIRWEGASIHDGYSIHVGGDGSYLALYQPPRIPAEPGDSYNARGGLNHLAVVVDDLSRAEARVEAAGFAPHSHADYEPGQRFYFDDADGIEYEVVSY